MRTHKIVVALAAVVAAALLPLNAATVSAAEKGTGRYIVVLESGANVRAVAAEHARAHGAQVGFVYRNALVGYSAVIPKARLDDVRADARVAYVEADGVVTASAQVLPWGIDKVDADVSSTLAGNGSGAVSNVNVYVIDSGVDTAHKDLNVVGHVNFAGGANRDCNGHGTHVAGTVAAKDDLSDVVGVAPGAPITGVKVLGCGGSGTTSGVIKGVDWVTANAKKPAIANMSLGGGISDALDTAVTKSADNGVFYAVAAGNNGADACKYSPARAGAGTDNGVMTVAATDSSDKEASWSNYGNCVDVWAPGVSILSTKLKGGTTTMSGTSMASPHGGGGGALYLSTNPTAGPVGVEAALRGPATSTANMSKGGMTISRLNVGGF
jgi:aqualysin 1